MNQRIRERIAQINRGEIPAGYKMTKAGICPVEWEEKRLLDLFDRQVERNKENNKNVLTISAQQGLICQDKFFNKNVASEDKSNYYLMRKNDFVYNKSYSSGYPLGAIKRLVNFEKGVVSPLYICFRAKKSINISFYDNYFESGRLNRDINSYAQEGARNHGLLNIAIGDFFNSHLLFPTPQEQQKIAEILGVWDKAIEKEQKLIDKLEERKIALMQKLLTPKEGWRKVEVGDIGTILGSSIDKKISENDHFVKLLNYMDVYKNNIIDDNFDSYMNVTATNLQKEKFSLKYGDILFTPTSETANDIGHCSVFLSKKKDILFSYHLIRLRLNCDIDTYYRAFMFKANYIRKQFYKKAVGPIRFVINAPEFEKVFVYLPPIKEQYKIATILLHNDKELTLHNKKLQQIKKQKQALMQLLLNGIVRVNK